MAYNNYYPVGYQPYPYQMPQQPMQPQIPQQMAPSIQAQQPQMPQQQQALQPQSFQMYGDAIFVNGREEAEAWVVQRGQTVRLWDRNSPRFFIKSVSENGMPNPIESYLYTKEGQAGQQEQGQAAVQPQPSFNPDDFVRREELDDLVRQLEELKSRSFGKLQQGNNNKRRDRQSETEQHEHERDGQHYEHGNEADRQRKP